jgi:hypothetical protein
MWKGLKMANYKWNAREGADHCDSCEMANGQVHPMNVWEAAEIVPRSARLYCGGDCNCTLDESDEDECGKINDIPLRGKESEEVGESQRVRFDFTGETVGVKFDESKRAYDILAITAGEGNGWLFTESALRESVELWEGAETFIDHGGYWGGRSVRDLAGVCSQVRFDEDHKGIRVRLEPFGPSGKLLDAIGQEWLEVKGNKPSVGFSADVLFTGKGKEVKQILRVFSLDLVYKPARGGAFLRVLNSMYARQPDWGVGELEKESLNMENETVEETKVKEPGVDAGLLLAVQETLLESKLSQANLPAALTDQVRKQFSGKVFKAAELDQSIQDARELLASLQGGGVIKGASAGVQMVNERDRLQAAADDLLGAPREHGMENAKVARLSGIRELYMTLTGDFDLHGRVFPERVALADSDSVPNILKNAFNKIMIQQWDELGRAGYRWWEKVVDVQHMESIQQVSGILLGEVSALGVVDEGTGYGELEIGDSGETKNFQKYGGLLPITIEMIDKDETHKLRQLPKKMVSSAVRNVSGLVSGLFTSSSGTGPLMADGLHVFEAAVHGNVGTAALAAASFEAASLAIYNQGMISTDTTKPKLALDAKYLLVPRGLRLTAMRILYPSFEREANIFSENMQRGDLGDVITVPEWSDANDWAAIADPRMAPGIILAERFGVMPELFVADNPLGHDMVHSDVINLKVRHFLAVFVADYRPLYKANVA